MSGLTPDLFEFAALGGEFVIICEGAPEVELRNDAAFERWSFLNRVTPYSSGNTASRTLEEAIANPAAAVLGARSEFRWRRRRGGSGRHHAQRRRRAKPSGPTGQAAGQGGRCLEG